MKLFLSLILQESVSTGRPLDSDIIALRRPERLAA